MVFKCYIDRVTRARAYYLFRVKRLLFVKWQKYAKFPSEVCPELQRRDVLRRSRRILV